MVWVELYRTHYIVTERKYNLYFYVFNNLDPALHGVIYIYIYMYNYIYIYTHAHTHLQSG